MQRLECDFRTDNCCLVLQLSKFALRPWRFHFIMKQYLHFTIEKQTATNTAHLVCLRSKLRLLPRTVWSGIVILLLARKGAGIRGNSSGMMDSDSLIVRALQILDGVPALATRRRELVSLSEDFHLDALHVGVVGVTSSGKSTFVNALMGESLLPEEARATTNLLVKCRHGAERKATLYFRDGRPPRILRSDELTRERMAELCSEQRNPGNREQLSRIEWTTPNSCIPPGLVLVDTPGLDAAGYESHQDITLRQFLPLADIVIYMTSIRNPFKAADLQAVGTVLENDQRILFVLSQIDLERDSYEAGELIKSCSDKLKRHRHRLTMDLAKIKGLRSYGVELVSSSWAKQGHSDKHSDLWKKSRFPRVLDRLRDFREQLKDLVAETRAARVRVQLERTLRELEQAEQRLMLEIPRPETGRHSRLQCLDRSVQQMSDRLQQLDREMGDMIEQSASFASPPTGRSLKAFQEAFADAKQHLDNLRVTLVSRTDQEQARLRSDLEILGIRPARMEAAHRRLGSSELPDVDRFVTTSAKEVKTRDWGWRWNFWPKSEVKFVKEFDSAAALEALKSFVQAYQRDGTAFMGWWSQHVESVFIGPVRNELESEQRAAMDMESLIQVATENVKAVSDSRRSLAALLSEEVRTPATEISDLPVEESWDAPAPAPGIHEGSALIPIISMFRELELSRTLERMAARIRCGDAPILAVGRDRTPHLRLLSMLAHDLRLFEYLERVPPSHWIVACESGIMLPGPIHQWSIPESLRAGLPIVVAPADECLDPGTFGSIVRAFSAMFVEVDAPRIGAGMSDLVRAPYHRFLTDSPNGIVFTCGHGAFFAKNRFSELIRDVIPQLSEAFGPRPLFVYEDYDVRHTHLLELHSRAALCDNPRLLPRLWREEGLWFDAPFTEAALQELAVGPYHFPGGGE